MPEYANEFQAGDAYSGPDLDALLAYSFRQVAEDQHPNNILDHCHLWQSTRFDDPGGVEELLNWSPLLQRSQRWPRRYQILPFYYTERWQLAVFDIVENVAVCYDTVWASGSPNSTFIVGQTPCVCPRLEADLESPVTSAVVRCNGRKYAREDV